MTTSIDLLSGNPADGFANERRPPVQSAPSGALSPPSLWEADPITIIERAQRGEQEAFSSLMEYYRERLTRLAYHWVGNLEDAQDLCQEIFVRVYRSLGSFDRRRPFAPWIYRIAQNMIYDHLRQKRIRPKLIDSDP